MKTYLLYLWDSVRSSYWFVPTLFAIAALALSFMLPSLDAKIAGSSYSLPESIRTTTVTARSTLSAMAGAMIAVTGTVFSITIVTLSLASQQFGPRLLRRFMYDLTTQITLGFFLSTSCYCLLLLRVIEQHDDRIIVPHLSVLMAVALSVMSMAYLIIFIHHIAIMIQAPHVVAGVANDLTQAIDRLFPESIGEVPAYQDANVGTDPEEMLDDNFIVIRSQHSGYIQAIDGDGMLSLAREHDLIIRLRPRPGNFVAIESHLADVWLAKEKNSDALPTDELARLLNQSIIVGIRRTPRQDVECAIDELVEVAVRALSPGINDPFTAINCIDHLGAALGRLATRSFPTAYRYDEDERLRLIVRHVVFPEILDAAFNQIRQYGRDSVAVTIRLLEALQSISEHVCHDEDRAALQLHGEMTLRLSASFAEEYDRQEVEDRFQQLKKSLDAKMT